MSSIASIKSQYIYIIVQYSQYQMSKFGVSSSIASIEFRNTKYFQYITYLIPNYQLTSIASIKSKPEYSPVKPLSNLEILNIGLYSQYLIWKYQVLLSMASIEYSNTEYFRVLRVLNIEIVRVVQYSQYRTSSWALSSMASIESRTKYCQYSQYQNRTEYCPVKPASNLEILNIVNCSQYRMSNFILLLVWPVPNIEILSIFQYSEFWISKK